MENKRINLAIFASGAGSNAKTLIEYFKKNSNINIAEIVCNKAGAGVVDIAKEKNIPLLLIERDKFYSSDSYFENFNNLKIDFIILAGFLWKIPKTIIENFSGKILNIHPSLLPKYGGKNMYGHHVHEAVLANKESESGITIHEVDEIYDNGKIIFQTKCQISENENVESLTKKIQSLEHLHFSNVVDNWIKQKLVKS